MARSWLAGGGSQVVTLDVLDLKTVQLQREVVMLRRRVTRLVCLLRLLVVALKISGVTLSNLRLPEDATKRQLLRSIRRSRAHLPLRTVLRAIGLSHARYHSWLQKEQCALIDRHSCPRRCPQQLTPQEVAAIRDMVTSDEYRHVSTGTLAVLAQRLGAVFAAPTTWYRLVRAHDWRRPRRRIHPAKPKLGIRASRADEVWHVDTTLIRLLDGTRAHLHAVVDNFSRRILAWNVAATFDPGVTARLLLAASENIGTDTDDPMVLVDGGIGVRRQLFFPDRVIVVEQCGPAHRNESTGDFGRETTEWPDRCCWSVLDEERSTNGGENSRRKLQNVVTNSTAVDRQRASLSEVSEAG